MAANNTSYLTISTFPDVVIKRGGYLFSKVNSNKYLSVTTPGNVYVAR